MRRRGARLHREGNAAVAWPDGRGEIRLGASVRVIIACTHAQRHGNDGVVLWPVVLLSERLGFERVEL